MPGILKLKCFLIIKENGAVRVTKNRPALDETEIAVLLNLELPNMLFEKPQISATLAIPESAAFPPEIPVEMIDNIRDAVERVSGLNVSLTVGSPE